MPSLKGFARIPVLTSVRSLKRTRPKPVPPVHVSQHAPVCPLAATNAQYDAAAPARRRRRSPMPRRASRPLSAFDRRPVRDTRTSPNLEDTRLDPQQPSQGSIGQSTTRPWFPNLITTRPFSRLAQPFSAAIEYESVVIPQPPGLRPISRASPDAHFR
ncbi:S-locus lectin protein kinase family protein [Striga asiatica]|uniref:S-locus lectin protein kinase family protein n=1 Tax=Striga asiatica TaxID=4170 RepID=A0A5A7R058_STRAF|nr:S-locus lectin protein kinase family protein [Striga asiatica]